MNEDIKRLQGEIAEYLSSEKNAAADQKRSERTEKLRGLLKAGADASTEDIRELADLKYRWLERQPAGNWTAADRELTRILISEALEQANG